MRRHTQKFFAGLLFCLLSHAVHSNTRDGSSFAGDLVNPSWPRFEDLADDLCAESQMLSKYVCTNAARPLVGELKCVNRNLPVDLADRNRNTKTDAMPLGTPHSECLGDMSRLNFDAEFTPAHAKSVRLNRSLTTGKPRPKRRAAELAKGLGPNNDSRAISDVVSGGKIPIAVHTPVALTVNEANTNERRVRVANCAFRTREEPTCSGHEDVPCMGIAKVCVPRNSGTASATWSARADTSCAEAHPERRTLVPDSSVTAAVLANRVSGFRKSHAGAPTVQAIQGSLAVEDSIVPAQDRQMPFGPVIVGLQRTEYLTLRNNDASRELVVHNISIGRHSGVYCEDFDDGLAQGWQPDLSQNWRVLNGEYRAQSAQQNLMVSTYGGRVWSNVEVQVSCRRDGALANSAGVVLRASAGFDHGVGSAYVFQLSRFNGRPYYGGSYGVWKQVNGSAQWLQPWTYTAAIAPGVNVMRAVAQGTTLAFYINGALVWTGNDYSLSSGRIGLLGYTGQGDFQCTHYYDDVHAGEPGTLGGGISAGQEQCYAQPEGDNTVRLARDGGAARSDWGKVTPSGPSSVGMPQMQSSTYTMCFTLSNMPALPCVIGPESSVVVAVRYAPQAEGWDTAAIVIESNETNEPQVEVALRGMGITDYLVVEPAERFEVSGPVYGPFTPMAKVYTLLNASATAVSWSAGSSAAWLGVTPTRGVLTAGAQGVLTAYVTSVAAALPGGIYDAMMIISNHTSGVCRRRSARLWFNSVVLYSNLLDENPGGLLEGQWEFGVPLGQGGSQYGYPDPTSGATGTNVLGVNLAGDYGLTVGGPWYAIFGPIDCSTYANVQLRYQRWLNTYRQPFATAEVQVSSDGVNWHWVWMNGDSMITDATWCVTEHDIGLVADRTPTLYLRWGYAIAGGPACAGWNIDDIELKGYPTQAPDNLQVRPAEGLIASGYEGGSFTPAAKAFVVSNSGETSVRWSATAGAEWVEVSPVDGMLGPGAAVPVTVAFNSAVNRLGPGYHATAVVFSNHVSEVAHTRGVLLVVNAVPVPEVTVSTPDMSVPFDIEAFTISGRNNPNVVGVMTWTNTLTGETGTLAAAPEWSFTAALGVGMNTFVITGTNILGHTATGDVTISRGDIGTGAPFVDILTENTQVPYGDGTYLINGTNNQHVVGTMAWVLRATTSWFARAGLVWEVRVTGLAEGTNVISVFGTNAWGVVADDSVLVIRPRFEEAGPVFLTNALLFPAEGSLLEPDVLTNMVWFVERITDAQDGTNVLITRISVHVTNALHEFIWFTNNIPNPVGRIEWLVPPRYEEVCVVRFDVTDSSGITNTHVFQKNVFTIVPEPAMMCALLVSVFWVQWRSKGLGKRPGYTRSVGVFKGATAQ